MHNFKICFLSVSVLHVRVRAARPCSQLVSMIFSTVSLHRNLGKFHLIQILSVKPRFLVPVLLSHSLGSLQKTAGHILNVSFSRGLKEVSKRVLTSISLNYVMIVSKLK